MNQSVEHVLEGGNVAETVVRVGSTVRKPATVSTAAVEALLDHFADVGFSGAPRSLGRDELGRHVLEYVPGEIAYSLPPLTASELRRVGGVFSLAPPAAHWRAPPPDDTSSSTAQGRSPILFRRSQQANCAASVPLSTSPMTPPRASN